MFNCTRCDFGIVSYEEDYRMVSDTCYHCGGTGKIDEETYYHDQLVSVAYNLAQIQESEYEKIVNENPDGEGYSFAAAENMMSSYDYYTCRVHDRADLIIKELLNKTVEEKNLLIKWNEA